MKVILTIGDPAGIGPEITVKALISLKTVPGSITVICDRKFLSSLQKNKVFNEISEKAEFSVIPDRADYSPGCPSIETAKISYALLNKAFGIIREKENKGACLLVTGPISKEWWNKAGIKYSGHTELLADEFKSKCGMVFVSTSLKVVTATRHLALRDIAGQLSISAVEEAISTAKKTLTLYGKKEKRIAVLGLNPHSGDGGLLGSEEKDIIIPAMNNAKEEGFVINGPFPTDCGFYETLSGKYDIVVAMYHDQAILPVKLLSSRKSMNLTVGLPFIRVSPLHGTAFDIAGKNSAYPESMLYALVEGLLLASQKYPC